MKEQVKKLLKITQLKFNWVYKYLILFKDVLDLATMKAHVSTRHPSKSLESLYLKTCEFCGATVRNNSGNIRRHLEQMHGLSGTDYTKRSRKTNLGGSPLKVSKLNNAARAKMRRKYRDGVLAKKGDGYDRLLGRGHFNCSLCPNLEKSMSLVNFYSHVIFHFSENLII